MKNLSLISLVVALSVAVPVCVASVPSKQQLPTGQAKSASCLEDVQLAQLLGVFNRRPDSGRGLQSVTLQMNRTGHVKSVSATPVNCDPASKTMLGELKRLKLSSAGNRAKTIKVTFLPAPAKRVSSN